MKIDRVHTEEELLFINENKLPETAFEGPSRDVTTRGVLMDQSEKLPRVRVIGF